VRRFVRFNGVSALGCAVQLAIVAAFSSGGVHYAVATAAGVAVAVVHNFVWHRRWTWRDRPAAGRRGFVRFALSTGAVSLVGNLAIVAIVVEAGRVPPVAANAAAVAACGLVNFWISDRHVFPVMM
jgi:putative flippase GtrA